MYHFINKYVSLPKQKKSMKTFKPIFRDFLSNVFMEIKKIDTRIMGVRINIYIYVQLSAKLVINH